jgi:aryl-alcohol dehydrogenase-like predicted oxidoreductase
MKRRPVGATGITVGEIGLGAWQLANSDWGVYDRSEALRVVQQALDAGCDFFDTAPPYGGGRSEKLLGRALAGVRPSVTICTKFGHSAEFPPTNFDVAALRPALKASLRRLRTDTPAYQISHGPTRVVSSATIATYLWYHEVFGTGRERHVELLKLPAAAVHHCGCGRSLQASRSPDSCAGGPYARRSPQRTAAPPCLAPSAGDHQPPRRCESPPARGTAREHLADSLCPP